MSNTERTFIMIKPDGVHRGLVGEIIKRFEQKGYKLVAMKFEQVVFSFSVERLFPEVKVGLCFVELIGILNRVEKILTRFLNIIFVPILKLCC
jgi:nucleoside diphosphate kinase